MISSLVVGDCLMEMNRFTKKYRVYRLVEIEDTYAYGQVIISTDGRTTGQTVGMELLAHAHHKNCTWLTYYLPAGKVLYGTT